MQRVAVDQNLTDVQQLLKDSGYEVVNLDSPRISGDELKNCDAVVITGLERNFAGRQDILTRGSVIDATGMSAMEVLDQVNHRLGRH